MYEHFRNAIEKLVRCVSSRVSEKLSKSVTPHVLS